MHLLLLEDKRQLKMIGSDCNDKQQKYLSEKHETCGVVANDFSSAKKMKICEI